MLSRHTYAVVVIRRGRANAVSWRFEGGSCPDLGVVDWLARLRLAARRAGWAMSVHEVRPDLWALLELVGLDLLASGVEVRRQPERGEQACVEEVVHSGDPTG